MADEDYEDDGLIEVEDYDPVRFREQLAEKGALMACPACGKRDWGFPEDGVFHVPGYVSEQGVDFKVKMHMECAPVICNNCDFVRFHSLGLVMG